MNRMANRVMKYTGPIIEERLRMEQEHGADWPGKPVCILCYIFLGHDN